MKKVYLLILQSFALEQLIGYESTWTGEADEGWNNKANWIRTAASAMENKVIFDRFSEKTSIRLDGIRHHLTSLTFNTTASYTIADMKGGALIFDKGPTSAEIVNLKGMHWIDLPLIVNTEMVMRLSSETGLHFGKNASLASAQAVTIEGFGDLINESSKGFSADAWTLRGVTVINHEKACFGEKARLIQIKGATFINGDMNAEASADAAMDAQDVEMQGGTIVNERSNFGDRLRYFKMASGTVINRGGSRFCQDVSRFEVGGGTVINDDAQLCLHTPGNMGDIIVHKGTVINQNKGVLGSSYTNITFDSGIIINGKESQISTGKFQMNGGTLINDGVISIVEYKPFFQMQKGVITGTGSFISADKQAFTFSNADRVIPGTISSEGMPEARYMENYYETFLQDILDSNAYGQEEKPDIQFMPGTLALGENGSYEQTENGTLVINVVDKETHGQLVASSAELGGTLQINALSEFDVKPGEPIVVLSSPSGIKGTFSSVEAFNLPSMVPLVSYLGGSVQVSFSPIIDSYIGGMAEVMFSSVNHLNIRLDRQMQRLRDHFVPEALPIVEQRNTSFLLANNAEDRLMRPPVDKKERAYPWNVYLAPIGSLGKVESKPHQPGLDYWSAGALTGVDYAWSQVGLGLSFEYERIHASVSQNWGHFNTDHIQASLYTTFAPKHLPGLSLNGIVGGGCEWYHISRNTGTLTTHETARGTPRGGLFDGLFGMEYVFKSGHFSWAPLASLQYIYLRVGKYKERDAHLFDMQVAGQKAQSLRSLLGMKLAYGWDWVDFSFNTQIDGAWQREYLDHNRSIGFSPLHIAGPASSVSVVGAGRNTALAGIDLLFTFHRRYTLEASYDFEWNNLFLDHFFYLGFGARF